MPDDDNEQIRIEEAELVRCDHGGHCPFEDCDDHQPHERRVGCDDIPCNTFPNERVQCIPVSSYEYYARQLTRLNTIVREYVEDMKKLKAVVRRGEQKETTMGELMKDKVIMLAVPRNQPGVLREVLTEMKKKIPVLPRREDYLQTERERCRACGDATPGDEWCNRCRPPEYPRTDEEIADYLNAIEEAHEAERMQRDGNVTFAIRERKDHVDGQADKDD